MLTYAPRSEPPLPSVSTCIHTIYTPYHWPPTWFLYRHQKRQPEERYIEKIGLGTPIVSHHAATNVTRYTISKAARHHIEKIYRVDMCAFGFKSDFEEEKERKGVHRGGEDIT